MFRHEGPSRSVRKNAVLAAHLAAVAGFVNAAGFVLLGAFTSHVTGTVGRLGEEWVRGDRMAALWSLAWVLAFFFGAVVASLLLAVRGPRVAVVYGVALALETLVLAAFAALPDPATPVMLDLHACMLCFAMGMQNSLVTRLSGAVVRTTHLTGVVTDLGIEVAHWLNWLAARSRVELPRPARGRLFLLSVIAGSFVIGTVVGALGASALGRLSLLGPAFAVALASAYAFSNASNTAPSTRW